MEQPNSGVNTKDLIYQLELWDEEKNSWIFLKDAYLQEALSYNWRFNRKLPVTLTLQGIPLNMHLEGEGYSGTMQMPFQCGKIKFEIIAEGIKVQFYNNVYPDERKVTQEQYELMIKEIIEEAATCFKYSGLALDVNMGGKNRKCSWAQWDYIDSNILRLRTIFNNIEKSPMKVLKKYDSLTELEKVKRIGTRTEQWISLHGEVYGGTEKSLPSYLQVQKSEESLNLYENQAVKKQLMELWLLLKKYAQSNYEDVRVKAEAYLEQVSFWQKSSFLSRVKALDKKVTISQGFRKHPVYRQWFNWFEELYTKGNKPIDFSKPMPLKDTFQVYEMWAYMRVVKAFRRLGMIESAKELFSYKDDGLFLNLSQNNQSKILLKNNGKLYYQRYYNKNSSNFYSYTQDMIPDIAWEQDGQIIVFDPKYRVESNLANAIAEMHKYRDGILSRLDDDKICKETYIIAPKKGEDSKELFSEGYRKRYGMGAFEIRSGEENSEFGKWIEERIK